MYLVFIRNVVRSFQYQKWCSFYKEIDGIENPGVRECQSEKLKSPILYYEKGIMQKSGKVKLKTFGR